MAQSEENSLFTIGVFQDTAWAERGLDALKRHGFGPEALSVIARHSDDVAALVERALGGAPTSVEVGGLGAAIAQGSLVGALQGDDEALGKTGIAATVSRAGFQSHDGYIFATLTARAVFWLLLRANRSQPTRLPCSTPMAAETRPSGPGPDASDALGGGAPRSAARARRPPAP